MKKKAFINFLLMKYISYDRTQGLTSTFSESTFLFMIYFNIVQFLNIGEHGTARKTDHYSFSVHIKQAVRCEDAIALL